MGISIAQRTSNGTTMIPIVSRAFEQRTLWIEGEINEETAVDFVRQIIELNRQSTTEPIQVMIASCGGSVIHGLAMYDAISSSRAPVDTYCIGTAYSMGAVLFVAGRKRYMLPHSKVMLHEPLISQGAGGSASSVQSMSESLQATKQQLNKILCEHTGRTKKQMEKATDHDNYFTAEEAIAFGLADEVVGIDQII